MWKPRQLPIFIVCTLTVTFAHSAWANPEAEKEQVSLSSQPSSIAQAVSVVTGIQLNRTDRGLEVILETAGDKEPRTFETRYGNTLAIDVINAQLRLPEAEAFREENPLPGIASVEVVQQYTNSIRVIVTGTDEVPTAEVVPSPEGFAFNVTSPSAVADQPPTPEAEPSVPTEEPEPAPPTAEEVEPIELIVTATRTAEEEEDIPRSVTVVTREQIEEQTNLTTNLGDILGLTVPGLGPPTQRIDNNVQSLRGRGAQILIDGVPINTNQSTGFPTPLRSIAPSAIERIEVVRGPSAAFGEGATGGVINIITRQPEEKLSQTLEGRVNSRGDLTDESFGTYLEYGVSGTDDPFDFAFNISWETFGFAFDGEGDRIPGIENNTSMENGRNINVLGKLGVDIGENQRLQFSVNHFDEDSEVEFINDPNVDDDPDAEKARAIPVDLDCIDVECGSDRRFTSVSLNYSNDSIFGSQLRLQGFYRDNYNLLGPFQGGGNSLIAQQESERFGGRLEVETPFFETFNLLWGADYSNEEASQPYLVLDDEFVTSGFRVARLDEEVIFTPPFTVENLGLFAQAQWDVTPRWQLSGGARYENIGLSVDDYTATLFQEKPIDMEGGSISTDDVVFNIGTVYDLTDELNVFANFSQGFGVPDFGRLLRFPPDGFRSLEEDLEFTAPQKVNNYELGFRGQWDNVQFSLAGFYNESELGVSLIRQDDGPFQIARGPERIYGIEATIDWQPSPTWQLGGLISWNEGENDLDEDGDFQPLSTGSIQPLKITAYVENETLPGWRNRFQALYVGGRDRAFDPDEGPDFVAVESYFLLDYIGSIQLGPGTVQIGIQNLLGEEYFPIFSQLFGVFGTDLRIAAPGRTISVGYRVTF